MDKIVINLMDNDLDCYFMYSLSGLIHQNHVFLVNKIRIGTGRPKVALFDVVTKSLILLDPSE